MSWTRAAAPIAFAVACVSGTGPLHAQAAATSTAPTIGIVGGLSSAKIVISAEGGSLAFDSRSGLAAGVSLTYPLDQGLSLEFDGLYVQQGFDVASGSDAAALNIDYLQFPALLRYGFGTSSIYPFVVGGVAAAYKAKCTGAFSSGGVSVSEGCGQDVKDFDYGLVIGGGISGEALSGSVRYFWGQGDIVDVPDGSIRNRVLMVLLEYRLSGT